MSISNTIMNYGISQSINQAYSAEVNLREHKASVSTSIEEFQRLDSMNVPSIPQELLVKEQDYDIKINDDSSVSMAFSEYNNQPEQAQFSLKLRHLGSLLQKRRL